MVSYRLAKRSIETSNNSLCPRIFAKLIIIELIKIHFVHELNNLCKFVSIRGQNKFIV
ncbi:MAG: hypothetical protein LBC74_00745 [Planctomycetaceae bacterium]|nr:hypothetical protein [Planctomycetaceae bacterium]